MEKVEQEINQRIAVACVRRVLDQAEGGRAVGPHPAQFPVEIGLAGGERCDRGGNRRVFMCPVESGPGQQPDRAPIEPGVHPISVELDLVQPLGPIRRRVDQPSELRFDPTGERGRLDAA